MRVCYKCGIGEDKTFLYKGISKEGIVDVCRKCLHESGIPIMEKKTIPRDFDPGKRESVRERLSRMAGIKENEFDREKELRKLVEDKKEDSLNEIVEKNFKKSLSADPSRKEELIDNFHWVVMRKRRALKMTRSELAKAIFEPVIAIESIEKGLLPKDYLALVRKLESFLKVRLFKVQKKYFGPKIVSEESKVDMGVTVGDLKEIHSKIEEGKKGEGSLEMEEKVDISRLDLDKVEEVVGKPIDSNNAGAVSSKKKKGISQEELDRIIFG